MIDIAILRADPDRVRENLKKKFQDNKLPLVDEALALDEKRRALQTEGDALRAARNTLSKQIGLLMREKKTAEAEAVKAQVNADAARLADIEAETVTVSERLKAIMMRIPNFISDQTPIGKNDTENVERERFLEPKVPDFEIPYHVEILERLSAIDLDSARRTSGQGFYYLIGDVARLHSAVLAYARDFMIGKGFTYVIPPFMIRSDVVSGVMSFEEMEGMMYKIEGEDLYLIGTSEHSMIGRFMNTTLPAEQLPLTLTSYSPCFRKEKGAHGIEERGIYRDGRIVVIGLFLFGAVVKFVAARNFQGKIGDARVRLDDRRLYFVFQLMYDGLGKKFRVRFQHDARPVYIHGAQPRDVSGVSDVRERLLQIFPDRLP